MAAVGAAISAIGTWLVGAGAPAWLVSAAGNLLLSTAVGAVTTALQRASAEEQRPPGITTEYTTDGGTQPQSFIVGWYATSGHMVCPPMSHGRVKGSQNGYLTYVINLGDVPRQTLLKVFVDDKEVAFEDTETAQPIGGSIVRGKSSGWYTQQGMDPADPDKNLPRATYGRAGKEDYKGKVWLRYYDGTQTAADPYLLQVYGEYTSWAKRSDRPWLPTMVGIGTCYAVLTFKLDHELFPSFPRCRFEMGGIPLYDPRKDSTAGGSGPQRAASPATWATTTNAEVIKYNVLRGIPIAGGPFWGFGVPQADLPLSAWAPSMNAADPPVDGKPRWQAGIEITVDSEPLEILAEINKATTGQLAEIGGVWKTRIGPPAAPVLYLTDAEIVTTDAATYAPHPSLEDTWNGVHASYPEPESLWEAKDAPPRYNATYEAADQGRRRVAELNLPACPWKGQVQRVMRAYIEEERRFRRHTLALPPNAQILEPLDAISWSSDENGYVSKIFEVKAVREDLTTGIVVVDLLERDPADYDWKPEFILPSTAPSLRLPKDIVEAPSFFTAQGILIAATPGGPQRAAVQLRWGGWATQGVSAVAWELELGGETVARGMVPEAERGEHVASSGILPLTEYRARISFLSAGGDPIAWTPWVPVTTPDARLSRSELAQDVIATLDDLEEWVEGAPALLDAMKADIDGDIATVDGRVTGEVATLSAEIDAVIQSIVDNLDLAKGYTDTEVLSEITARQTAVGQLSARLDQITAANISNNLLVNGDFADGANGWSGVTVANGRATVTASPAEQVVTASFDVAELAQWRLDYSGPAGSVRVAFLDSGGALLGSEAVTTIAATQTTKVASGQHTPPENTARIRFRVTPKDLVLDNVALTKIDQQVLARIQAIELAQTGDAQALTAFKTEAKARFEANEARIGAEETTRSSADKAVATRIGTLETTAGTQGARLATVETAIADQSQSIGQVKTLIEAESGRRDIVRDGSFAQGTTYWPAGSLPMAGRIAVRNAASSDARFNAVPADRCFNFLANDPVGDDRISLAQPVTPGETIELSFDYYRLAQSVVPRVRIAFRDAKADVTSYAELKGEAAAGWVKASKSVVVPANAVAADLRFAVATAGSAAASITNLSALRTGAGYASAAGFTALQQSVADDKQALATYKTEVAAKFSDVVSDVSANTTAISRVYTKAQTDSAIAARIDEFDASLTDRFGAKASASAVTALTARVKETEDGLEAQTDRIDSVTARTNRGTASGQLRVAADSGPSGVRSRVGLRAEATSAESKFSAALYLEARDDGTSAVTVQANRFALVTNGDGEGRRVPFVVDGNEIVMDAAYIKKATIGTLQVEDGAFSETWSTSVNLDQDNSSVSINLTPYSNRSKLVCMYAGSVTLVGALTSQSKASGSLIINGTTVMTATVSSEEYVYKGGDGTGYRGGVIYPALSQVRRAQSGQNTVGVRFSGQGSMIGTLYVLESKR